MTFCGYELLSSESGREWKQSSDGNIAKGKKHGKLYQIKVLKKAPYPDKAVIKDAALAAQRLNECRKLLQERRQLAIELKEADDDDHVLAYAQEVILNETDLPHRGVMEAVPFIDGALRPTDFKDNREWLLSACLGAAQALMRLHEAGYAHLDVKTVNYVFTAQVSRVLFFSVAKKNAVHATLIDFDRTQPIGHIAEGRYGTQEYMAPELIRMLYETDKSKKKQLLSRLGPATDIFALGIVFCELLSGGIIPEILEPVDPEGEFLVRWDRSLVCKGQGYLEALITAMLANDPGDRPSAEQVVEALETQTFSLPEGVFELWPEHEKEYAFSADIARKAKSVRKEQVGPAKTYIVLDKAGSVQHYNLMQLKNLRYISSKSPASAPDPIPGSNTGLKPDDAASYILDLDMLRQRGYSQLRYTADGSYILESSDGRSMKMTLQTLLFFKIVIKKA